MLIDGGKFGRLGNLKGSGIAGIASEGKSSGKPISRLMLGGKFGRVGNLKGSGIAGIARDGMSKLQLLISAK